MTATVYVLLAWVAVSLPVGLAATRFFAAAPQVSVLLPTTRAESPAANPTVASPPRPATVGTPQPGRKVRMVL